MPNLMKNVEITVTNHGLPLHQPRLMKERTVSFQVIATKFDYDGESIEVDNESLERLKFNCEQVYNGLLDDECIEIVSPTKNTYDVQQYRDEVQKAIFNIKHANCFGEVKIHFNHTQLGGGSFEPKLRVY